eukprot:SAG22_NODE_212_length_15072_cov_3.109197_7_plen_134_part_00
MRSWFHLHLLAKLCHHLQQAWSLPGGLAKCSAVGEQGTPFSPTTPWGRAFVGTPWCKVGPPRYPGAVRGFNTSCRAGGKGENSSLFNGMISPLTQLAISGILWFQGEQNAAENRYVVGRLPPPPPGRFAPNPI